jgi:hypothetical protein
MVLPNRLFGVLVCFSTVTALTATACDAPGTTELTGSRLRGGPPAVGSTDGHDPADTTGANTPDTGNPNATSKPNAPSTTGTANAEFALTLANNTPTVGLGDSTQIDVSVQPKNGFNAPVTVTVTGLPGGATAAPLQLTPGTPGKLVIQADVTTTATASGQSTPIVVTGTAGGLSATANANFKVAPKLTLTIPVNIDALRAAGTQYRDEWGDAFGSNQQALTTQPGNGIVVTVFNADSKAHIIHGANGFAHGDTNNPVQPNAFELSGGSPRTRTLNPGTNCNGYPHDGGNGSGASFRIKVVAAN